MGQSLHPLLRHQGLMESPIANYNRPSTLLAVLIPSCTFFFTGPFVSRGLIQLFHTGSCVYSIFHQLPPRIPHLLVTYHPRSLVLS